MKTQFSPARLPNAVWCFVFSAMLVSTGYAQVGLKPVITNQPSDLVVLDNASVTFRVEASSATTMSYKWYHNSNLISGATAITYTINPAQFSGGQAGFYHVEVINAAGSTLSRVARLTILASNDIPVANNDNYTTQEGVPLTVPAPGILANDVDLYPGPLTAALVSNVNYGTLSLNINGGFIYNPKPGYSGSDSFIYRVLDGGTTILEQNTSGGTKLEIKKDEPASQSFRHGAAGQPAYRIKKIALRLSKETGETNDLNFSIGTGINSGSITGSSYTITMASISNATDGASFQDYEVVYNASAGPFTAGTTYHLNFDNSPNGKKTYVELASSSTYPQGTCYKNAADTGKDMRFEIHEITPSGLATVIINVTPTNDALRFVAQPMTTNGYKLVLSGPVLSSYVILASTNLTAWTPISTNYTDTGKVVFTNAANHALRFYRGMVLATNSVLEQNLNATGKTAQVFLGQKGAQSFRHGTNGGPSYVVGKVVLRFSRSVTGPQTNLNFNIGTGINSGTIAGSSVSISPSSITNTTSGASFQNYDAVFAMPVGPLTAGTTYYLNMDCEASNGRRIYFQYGPSNGYANGTYYQAGIDNLSDIWFQVWGP